MTEYTRPWLKSYDPEVRPHIEFESIPVYTYLDRSAAQFPDRPAIIFRNTRVTYAELKHKAEVMAANLRADGLRSGDRVAIMLPNLPQTIIAYWAVLKAGGVVVMTNPLYMEKELVHQLNDSGATRLIALDLLWPKIEALRDKLHLDKIYVTRIPEALGFPLNLLATVKMWREGRRPRIPFDGKAVIPWKRLVTGKETFSCRNILPHSDLALLQYTGGTTGVSKGCMLTHANLTANVTQIREILFSMGVSAEVFLGVLPYFHVYGLTVCLLFATAIGATMVPFPRFEPRELLHAFKTIKPTIFPGAPSIYIALMQQKEFATTDFSTLKYCVSGSAPMPVDVLRRFEETTGSRIMEGYGLTEASPVTHINPMKGTRKPGTIGLPFPDTEARVVDMELGNVDLPPGKIGELIIRGPQVMKGYWGRPDDSANTVRNGWLYTGDIAVMDEDGFFTIVDRKKDMIISAGYNIYPREIDEVLYEHPKVQEAVAVGISHRTRGEVIKVFVVVKEGETLTRQEVINHCKEKLAGYKVPKLVEFRKELPKTLVGKVLRRALREEEERKEREKASRPRKARQDDDEADEA